MPRGPCGRGCSLRNKSYNKLYGKEKASEIKKKLSIVKKLSIDEIKEKYPLFSRIEELRYNPDKPGEKEIQVHCKNHLCPNSKEQGGWFTPTNNQITHRINTIENPKGFGESNFYCSEECKKCPLFNLRSDPLKETEKTYTQEEYQQFKEFVLKRDNYECQYCGEKATEIHHERPQKLEPFFALDPDLAWSCCKKCHYKYGHKTETECSTGNLASKICKQDDLIFTWNKIKK
jgi:5-methylcytosine-specific restriction enzyme A